MEWVKLGDVGKIITGNTPSKKNKTYYDSPDINFVSPGDIIETKRINHLITSENHISNSAREKARIVPKNSILVTCIGIIGKVAKIKKDEVAFNQQINAIVVDEKRYDIDYIAYAIMSNQRKLSSIANSAVVPLLNKSQFSDFEIYIDKSLEKQKKVASILNKIENLIQTRQDQIQALDDLIKSTFVEFINEYEIKNILLDHIFEFIDGDRGKNYPKRDDLLKEGYCLFLNAKNVTLNGFKFDDLEFISKGRDELLRKGKLKRGDIILTTRGTVGNVAYYDDSVDFENVRINSGMVILRKKININPIYFQEIIRNTHVLNSGMSGSAQPQLPIRNLKNIKIPIIDIEKQNQFAAFVEKIENQKQILNDSLGDLTNLFDSLMQDAFDGSMTM